MKALYSIISTSILLLSCQKDVKINLITSNRIIVDALITDVKGYNYIKLYRILDYYSNTSPDSISGAKVMVSDSLGNISYFLEKTNNRGYYTNNAFKGIIGNNYFLKMIINGVIYESSSRIIPIDTGFNIVQKSNSIEFYPSNKPDSYFRFYAYQNDSLIRSWFESAPDEWRGFAHIHQSDTFKIIELTISKDIFIYYYQLNIYNNNEEQPFDVPPIFPKGNISNGALGLFQSSSITEKIIIVK
jgi:hypothetical protein